MPAPALDLANKNNIFDLKILIKNSQKIYK